ncbi:MAG: MFS transporter, partial [Myxococcota bacterium]
VFLSCAVGIALNFIPLLVFREPEREIKDVRSPTEVLKESVFGLLEPRLFFFTFCFAGFWLMFYQLFDILPNFIDDWIDSRHVADALGSAVPRTDDGNMTQEWMINLNAGMIMILAFAFGYISGFMRPLIAIVVGIGVSAVAIYALGLSMNGVWTLAAIALFSIGEMLASPTKHRYLSGIAPPGKKGLYMGYVNMTVGIGWATGSVIAGQLYETGGDKVNLARRYLVEQNMLGADAAAELDSGAVISTLMERLDLDVWGVRELLWNEYSPQSMWAIFTGIGVGSLLLLVVYDRVVEAAKARPAHPFNTRGTLYVRLALVPISLAFGGFFVTKLVGSDFDVALAFLTLMFTGLFVASFFQPELSESPAEERGGAVSSVEPGSLDEAGTPIAPEDSSESTEEPVVSEDADDRPTTF